MPQTPNQSKDNTIRQCGLIQPIPSIRPAGIQNKNPIEKKLGKYSLDMANERMIRTNKMVKGGIKSASHHFAGVFLGLNFAKRSFIPFFPPVT
jgi:hypothetical protein